jgi:hypothetical protein
MSNKRTEWAKRIGAWRDSGESVTGFCRKRGLNYPQFVYWQRALRTTAGALVPVVIASAAPSRSPIELVLPNGVQARCTTVADALAVARGWSC